MVVAAEEVTEGSDKNNEGEEDEMSHSSNRNDRYDDVIWSDDDDPAMARIEYSINTFSLRESSHQASKLSKYRNTKAEYNNDQELWEQQPRVLIASESERDFDSV